MNSEEAIHGALNAAVEQTLTNMAFIDVMPADTPVPGEGVAQIIVIDITRPDRGTILLYLPLELKRQMVENIHADAWESLSSREIDDCLLELLNVLAGNFLLHLFGEGVKYNMTFPQIVFDEDDFDDLRGFRQYHYDAEGLGFSVSVRME